MNIRKICDRKHPSYLVFGQDGEEYYINNNWSADGTQYLGHEIYDIEGCFRKLCVFYIGRNTNQNADPKIQYQIEKVEGIENQAFDDTIKNIMTMCVKYMDK